MGHRQNKIYGGIYEAAREGRSEATESPNPNIRSENMRYASQKNMVSVGGVQIDIIE